jgi:hypothetical protein
MPVRLRRRAPAGERNVANRETGGANRIRGNVNVATMPYNRRKGMKPALDDGDIDAIVAFLRTLTDAPFEASAAARGAGVYSATKEGKR